MRLAHLHLTRFPVQRRVRETPSLAGLPFVLHEEVRGHRRVAFASTAALRVGVRPGLTLTAAQALCPVLIHFPYAPAEETHALISLGEALLSIAPAFQLSAPEGLWLDASAAPLCGGEEGLAQRALELCAAHGYRARCVVADSPFTARALARYGEVRTRVVQERMAASALAPLPLKALEGPEADAVEAFAGLGLTTLGEVATLPVGAVVARLGNGGLRAHRLCRGEDDARFVPQPLEEAIEERIELDWPAEALEPLLFALKTTLDRLCARLAGRRRAAVRLTFALRLDPTGEAAVGLALSRPSAQARLLLDLAKHRLADLTLQNPVAALCVRVDEACEDEGQQLSLGDEPQGDAALEVVLSRLQTALGEDALFAAELEGVHRPESAYARRVFRPPAAERGMLAEVARQAAGAQQAAPLIPLAPPALGPWEAAALPLPGVPAPPSAGGATVTALPRAGWSASAPPAGSASVTDGLPLWGASRSPPPGPVKPAPPPEPPASASLADGTVWDRPRKKGEEAPEEDLTALQRPVRCLPSPATLDAELGEQGELVAARLLGKRRKATAVAGPERLSGEWWSEDPFARDYYRVYFEGFGPAWIYRDSRDGRFYLHGLFD